MCTRDRDPRRCVAALAPLVVRPALLVVLIVLLLTGTAIARPVKAVADGRMAVGGGAIAITVSQDWSHKLPAVTRAVVIVHGILRNADDYFAATTAALQQAGGGDATLVIAPQFLGREDVAAHALPADMLRWKDDAWPGGEPALGPAPVSSFAVLDAIVARLADRARFPALREIVVAGHSAGGQLVQRYAVVGHAEPPAGVHLRYVPMNPSSYLYFTAERPVAVADCPRGNDWRYGFGGTVPAYVEGDPAALERRYVARDVVYLLGGADTDPAQRVLDRSCAAEAQGPDRLDRGLSYLAALRARDGKKVHQLYIVPGIGHAGAHMIGSACGRATLFGTPGCPDE